MLGKYLVKAINGRLARVSVCPMARGAPYIKQKCNKETNTGTIGLYKAYYQLLKSNVRGPKLQTRLRNSLSEENLESYIAIH